MRDLPHIRRPILLFLLAGASLMVLLFGALDPGRALLSAWELAILFLGGIALGSLGLVLIGRLLRNEWLDTVADELVPAAWSLVPIALLALPLLHLDMPRPASIIGEEGMTPIREAWFDREAMLMRLALFMALWLGLCVRATSRRRSRVADGAALAVLAATVTLAVMDLILLATPFWWSGILPLAFALSQLTAALSVAFIADLAGPERARDVRFRSLASALLALALVSLWTWFSQFLIAWMGNLPGAAGWYLARMEGAGIALLVAAFLLHVAAILMLILSRRQPSILLLASISLLAAHCLHSSWLLRPVTGWEADIGGLALMLVLTGLWAGWLVLSMRIFGQRDVSDFSHARAPDSRNAISRRSGAER